ncbi:molybdate transport repressor ModE-like protein [Fusobacterium naviforme]|nr:NTP transferase domain-containing protein [Fusobacterium naviforme]PSL11621.1 molybdate transport repressor ModE-like protein [Fusobacterium naviforme]STO26703.1 bifunctional N-acetylglucosamine-1-phosphate uridyltransferase/glucosamine-1-phosphate acetyltransferase [Fusobacterium naviforme]
MKVAAVIAAAGLSARMRDFKPLLCLGSSTIIHHTVSALQSAGAEEVIIVTGYQSAVLMRHLNLPGVIFLKNERFAETDMLASLQLGLAAVSPEADRIFLTPGDIPLVKPETMRKMLAEDAAVVRPLFEGRGGHPLLLRRDAVPAVLDFRGDGGLKGLLRTGTLQLAELETGDPGIRMDADTPQDYKRLLCYEAQLAGHGNLRLDLQLNIGMEELFLTTESVQLLDMIAQTGSIQNACACMHISYSKGWKIVQLMERQLGFPVVLRTIGGEGGGGSSLSSRGAELLSAYRSFHRELSEQAARLFDKHFPACLRVSSERQTTADIAERET